MSAPSDRPLRLFVSFAPKDRELKDELLKHLTVLQRIGKVEPWSVDQVCAGADWQLELEAALERADVALLLLSADFLASEFLQDVEVPKLFERRASQGLHIIPVALRTCLWQRNPWIGKLKPLPASGGAISSFRGDRRDRALTDVVQQIYTLVEDSTARGAAASPGQPVMGLASGLATQTKESPQQTEVHPTEATTCQQEKQFGKDGATPQDARLRAVLDKIKVAAPGAMARKLFFLLVGRTGVGKSSTVNALMGKTVAPVNDYEPETTRVELYDAEIHGIKFVAVDTPGLCDDVEEAGNDERYIDEIRSKVDQIDCVWFVSPMSETRLRTDEKRAIKLVTQAFGADVWKRSIVVFTFADAVAPAKYQEALLARSKLVRAEIERHAGHHGVDVPAVPTSNTSETTPDGQPWLGELFTKVMERVDEKGALSFLLATAPRIEGSAAPEAGSAIGDLRSRAPEDDNVANIRLSEQQKRAVRKSIVAKIFPTVATTVVMTGIGAGATLGPQGAVVGGVLGATAALIAWLFSDDPSWLLKLPKMLEESKLFAALGKLSGKGSPRGHSGTEH